MHPKFHISILSPKDLFFKRGISVKSKFLSSLELKNFLINFFLLLFLYERVATVYGNLKRKKISGII